MAVSRRNFIKHIGTSAFVASHSPKSLLADESRPRQKKYRYQVFEHGVASGDPLTDRVIIWTRVSTADDQKNIPVKWQVARDEKFDNLVLTGESVASADRDYTIKEDVILPESGCIFYYRFFALGEWSMIGRTKTLPQNSDHLRLAVCACSSIWSGNMNAYDRLAEKTDIDLIIHCGDYIYEAPDPDELQFLPPDPLDRKQPRSLSEIRRRYAFYRQSPKLKRAHQQHPFSIIWDNHDLEVAGPLGQWAAQKAFHEWTPTRSPQKDKDHLIYRKLELGSLVDIFLLDTRSIGRDTKWPNSSDPSLLGYKQYNWLEDSLKNSRAKWKIIASQVLMAPFEIAKHPLTRSTWDGYPQERQRLFNSIAENNIANVIVVSGDAHISFANNLWNPNYNRSIGVEFLPTSVSRGNVDEIFRGFFAKMIGTSFEKLVGLFNPHTKYVEAFSSGYGIVDIRSEETNFEFWYTQVDENTSQQRLGAKFKVESNSNLLQECQTNEPTFRKAEPLAPLFNHYFYKTPLIGGDGGTYFSEENWAIDHQALSILAIEIRGQSRLEGIRLIRSEEDDGFSYFGNKDKPPQRLNLSPNEKIIRIEVSTTNHRKSPRISFLSMQTNYDQYIESGTRTEDIQVIDIPSNWYLTGIEGRSDQEINALRFILRMG